MNHINPTGEQFKEFSSQKDDGPFVMINLLKFKKEADGSSEPGVKAYNRYMENVAPFLDEAGGRLLWLGDVDDVFIGTSRDGWDRVMLVEYPSRKAFLDMISRPEYLKVHEDREAGLETSALLAGKTVV
ncbi:MAG: DUF1330 domain-containing protein [Deltaproteobacteria bacterium]|nr:DUF1330 domain-containing protein [Deltaproteobacteria bacterium]